MKVLFVCRGASRHGDFDFRNDRAFVSDQATALRDIGVDVDVFLIEDGGITGYLEHIGHLRNRLADRSYDVVHAHYGLSGLVASLQRLVPTVVTFHGSDITVRSNNVISSFVAWQVNWSIFVSSKLYNTILHAPRRGYSIIPCGVNLEIFGPCEKSLARSMLGLDQEQHYVLFSSSFTNTVKNYPLASQALVGLPNVALLELKDYTREQVNLLLNACDVLLLTSFREGSPQVIKEAMACNCPIVSTDVGDVHQLIRDVDGCYLTSFDPDDVADKLNHALSFKGRTNGRESVSALSGMAIAHQVLEVYEQVIASRRRSK